MTDDVAKIQKDRGQDCSGSPYLSLLERSLFGQSPKKYKKT